MNKKKIAVVQFYFYPDISAASQLLGDLLSELAREQQFEITVICGSSCYADTGKNERNLTLFGRVRIRRLETSNFGRQRFIARFLDYFFYYFLVFGHLLVSKEWDVVISLTSPPLIGFVVAMALLFKKTPFIYYVYDLYPELLYDIGYIKTPWLVRKLQFLNRITFRRADRIVTIGKYMNRLIAGGYGVSRQKLLTVNNWSTGIDYKQGREKNDFTLLYSGNMGLAHDFSKLSGLIEKLRSVDVVYRFIGGGNQKERIRRIFRAEGESRVTFEAYTERSVHGDVISEADLFIIAQKKETVGDILPSKLYSCLAAGRPILFLGPRASEIGETVMANDIGVVLESDGDLSGVHRYISFLKNFPERHRQIGRRARELFERRYRLHHSVAAFRSLLVDIGD